MARRRKRSGFGVLLHRGASQTSVRSTTKKLHVAIGVDRNIGASRPNQFCAWANFRRRGRSGFGTKRAFRGSERMCAATPTKAVKKALAALTRKL